MGKTTIAAGIAIALFVGFLAGRLTKSRSTDLQSGGAQGDKVSSGEESGSVTLQHSPGSTTSFQGGEFKEETTIEIAERLKSLSTGYWSVDRLESGRALLELDAILKSAKESDFLELIQKPDFEKFPLDAVDLFYRRWAEISPENAAAVWLDRAGKLKSESVNGLLRVWAKKDQFAVANWIDGISDETAKKTANKGFLISLVHLDANMALDRLLKMDSDYTLSEISGTIGKNLTAEDLPLAAEKLMLKKEGKWQYQNELSSLIKAWGNADLDGAFDWVLNQKEGALQGRLVTSLLQELISKDPAAAAEKLSPHLEKGETFAKAGGELWLRWIMSGEDEEAALQFLKTHGDSITPPDYMQYMSGNYSAEKLKRSLDLTEEFPDGAMKRKFVRSLLHTISQSKPKVALEYMRDKLPVGSDSDSMIASAIHDWAQKGEPEKAVAWASENMEPGGGREMAIRFGVTTWSKTDPKAAIDYALKLPAADKRDSLWGIALEWPKSDPEGALKFIRTHDDPAEISGFTERAFWELVEAKGGKPTLKTALAMPEGKRRMDAVDGVFSGWAHVDAGAAALALREMKVGTLKDKAISGFIGMATRTDPSGSLQWALEINNPGMRKTHTMNTARSWLRSDRKKAEKWIQSSPAIPADLKETLLKRKN